MPQALPVQIVLLPKKQFLLWWWWWGGLLNPKTSTEQFQKRCIRRFLKASLTQKSKTVRGSEEPKILSLVSASLGATAALKVAGEVEEKPDTM